MEFAEGGDLMSRITEHSSRHTAFSESELWAVLVQVTTGLKALHDLKILHRDMKVRRFKRVVCQRVPDEAGTGQAGRPQCLQSRQKRVVAYADGDAVLCFA